jgi:hypothetical protein
MVFFSKQYLNLSFKKANITFLFFNFYSQFNNFKQIIFKYTNLVVR